MQRVHAQCSEELAKIIWNSSLFRVAPTLSASLLRSQIHHFGLLALTTWIPFHVLFLPFRPGKISDISLSQWENFAEAFDHALLTFCFHIRLSFHPTSLSPSPHHSSSCSPEVLHSNSRSQVVILLFCRSLKFGMTWFLDPGPKSHSLWFYRANMGL